MVLISETSAWQSSHPGAVIGLLELTGVNNAYKSTPLDQRKREIEAHLRAQYQGFSRKDLTSLEVMSAYKQYYSRFNKTYHVLLQIESIALKGKKLPNVSALVDSNFIAEMETLVLTAGHDVEKLQEPIFIDVSQEGDHITQMNGDYKPIRAGDMIMRDAEGVCCSILYGQDNRSPIQAKTSHVLYVAYAPNGVSAEIVSKHLSKIEDNIRLFSPTAIVKQNQLLLA